VANQLSSQRVDQVCVCGDGAEFKRLASAIEEQIKLPAIVVNPLEGIDLSTELRRTPPSDVARWAPLLGMLLDEGEGRQHAIDFLDPKKKPAPPSRKMHYAAAIAGVAALAVLIVGWIWRDLSNRDAANTLIANQIAANTAKDPKTKKNVLEVAKDTQTAWKEAEAWLAGDVVWLEELARASQRVPPADKVMVTKLLITSDGRGPAMTVDGLAADVATIDAVEQSLRDEKHTVESRQSSPDTSRPGYTRSFTIIVRPESAEAAAAAGNARLRGGNRPRVGPGR
jgi:hypothetical protein